MDERIRSRDVIWCQALVNTLDMPTVEKVLLEFNRIRPDQPPAVTQRKSGMSRAAFSRFIKSYVGSILRDVLTEREEK